MDRADQLIDSLLRPGVLPDSAQGVELIETHISWVLLAGARAWKLKKPLDLGFVDFSTVARRRAACVTELRLNRRTAPELYEAVVPVLGTAAAPCLGPALAPAVGAADTDTDAGAVPIDYLVRMRRFDQSALFPHLLDEGRLSPDLLERLARHVADFHAAAAVARPDAGFGTAEAVHAPVRQNFAQLRAQLADPAALALLDRAEAWAETQFLALRPLFETRLAGGWVRECHGDLHLGNLIVLDGEPKLFDAIEFSAELRWTDVIADIAFLVMDLQACGRADLSGYFLNAWLEHCGDYEGLRLLPYYLSYRALVRAKVAAIRAAQRAGAAQAESLAECRRYLRLASAQAAAGEPVLMISSGLSGAGKSSQSRYLLEHLAVIRLRADVERKRLFGLAAEAVSASPLRAGLYSAEASERTYTRLAELAQAVLAAGYPVLVDATFLLRAQRRRFAELAAALGVPFVILAFEAPLPILRERISRRAAAGRDASEADLQVLEMQRARREAFDAAECERRLVINTHPAPDWQTLRVELAALWPAALAGGAVRALP